MNTVMLLSEAWEAEAANWIAWARKPGHDSFWQYHRDQFMELVPPPQGLTVDIGCGEGRLSRHLKELGHEVRGFDASKTLIASARELDPDGAYEIARAEALPVPDNCADLAIAFMVLQDVDELSPAVAELSRLLKPEGRAVIAIVHPINSAGKFDGREEESEFVISGSYLEDLRYQDTLDRDGLTMTFHSVHRPIEHFSREFEKGGLLIEAMREHKVPESICQVNPDARRWRRLPLFLHFRLIKLSLP